MSFRDSRGLTFGQKLGCSLVAMVGVLATIFGVVASALGSCPDCIDRPVTNVLLFPGTVIFFLGLGVGMIWFFRWYNDRK